MAERVEVRVTNRLLVPRGTALDRALRPGFEHRNPQHRMKGARKWGGQYAVPELIRTWRLDEDERGEWLSLPRGGTGRVRRAAQDLGLELAWLDERTLGLPELAGVIPPHLLTLRDYQDEQVRMAVLRQNALLEAPTGSGKTSAMLGLAAELCLPTLVIVWTDNLLEQWVDRCGSELGMNTDAVGVVQGPRLEVAPITIAMQQTLASRPEWVAEHCRDFGLVVADEVQRVAAPTVFAAVDPWWSKYRVGVSADSSRKDRLEFIIHDLLGEVAHRVDEERLVRSGAVLEVEVVVVPTEFRAEWFVRRRGNYQPQDHHRLMTELADDAERTQLAVDIARDEAALGERVLVWAARREHCHAIDSALARAGVLSGLMLGGAEYKDRFHETRLGILGGSLRAGVGTVEAIGTGIDIPNVSRGVVVRPMHSNRQLLNQVRGRLCRPGSDDARLYYLWDRHVYGKAALQALARQFGARCLVREADGLLTEARHYLRRPAADREEVPAHDGLDGIFEHG